jgi:hypothetical protein
MYNLNLVDEITHRVVNEYSQAIAAIGRSAAQSTDARVRLTLSDAARQLRAFANARRAKSMNEQMLKQVEIAIAGRRA